MEPEPWPADKKCSIFQTRQGNSRMLQLFNALIVVAGLLLTATYTAVYAAPQPEVNPQGVSIVMRNGTFQGDITSKPAETPVLTLTWRFLNSVAFECSLICVVGCFTAVMCLVDVPQCVDDPPSNSDYSRLQEERHVLSSAGHNYFVFIYCVVSVSFACTILAALVAMAWASASFINGPNNGFQWSVVAISLFVGIFCALLFGFAEHFRHTAYGQEAMPAA